jgi:hypothetical protein
MKNVADYYTYSNVSMLRLCSGTWEMFGLNLRCPHGKVFEFPAVDFSKTPEELYSKILMEVKAWHDSRGQVSNPRSIRYY